MPESIRCLYDKLCKYWASKHARFGPGLQMYKLRILTFVYQDIKDGVIRWECPSELSYFISSSRLKSAHNRFKIGYSQYEDTWTERVNNPPLTKVMT